MSSVAPGLLQSAQSTEFESNECPICLRPMRKPHKCKTLYGVKVCRKCRNGFANRRQVAYLLDYLLYYLFFWLIFGGVAALLFLISEKTQVGSPLSAKPTAQDDFVATLIHFLGWVIAIALFLLKDAVRGISPGRWLCGVQVVDAMSREPIGVKASLKRNLCLMIPYVGFIGVVLTMMKGQRWGDGWAKTMVIWRKHARRVPFAPPWRYCRQCGYDLTGNVSGRCPECGIEVARPEQPRAFCLQCSYDLTGNVSGWCPECGRQVTNVPILVEGEFAPPAAPQDVS